MLYEMKPSLLLLLPRSVFPPLSWHIHKPSPSPSYHSSTSVLFQRTSSFKPTPLSRPQARGNSSHSCILCIEDAQRLCTQNSRGLRCFSLLCSWESLKSLNLTRQEQRNIWRGEVRFIYVTDRKLAQTVQGFQFYFQHCSSLIGSQNFEDELKKLNFSQCI